MTPWVTAAAATAAAVAMGGAPRESSPPIPLAPGLTIVEAYRNARGDFETIIRVDDVNATGVTLSASTDEATDTCAPRGGPGARRSWGARTVLRDDLDAAGAMLTEWSACPASAEIHPGTTAISVSARLLRELQAAGETRLRADTSKAGMVSGSLTLIERDAVPIEIVVNDRPATLRALHARWHSTVGDREYWFLADAGNPLVLRAAYMGKPYLQVVNVSFPADKPAAARLEQDLSSTGRTALYGIHFNSGSDRLRPESESVLAAVAEVLQRHAGWSLTIEGHTDNLGDAAYNMDLSRRRAAAVSAVLASRYRVAPGRLKVAAFGASRPASTNDTLEGRAQNRRVELVRP